MVKKGLESVARERGVTVAPSPFNEVKLDLAIILCVGVLLLLLQGRIVTSLLVQFCILSTYSLLGMAWLLFRTRRILARIQHESQAHGTE